MNIQTKEITTDDGVRLTYYTAGTKTTKNAIVIFNAPGMSIKFWLPIIQQLTDYFIVGAEYRGFPDARARSIVYDEDLFPKIVSDYHTIITHEQLEHFHCASWYLGAKAMLRYYTLYTGQIQSLTALNMSYTCSDVNRGHFSQLLYEIKRRIESNPASIDRMVKLMGSVGTIPNIDFISMIQTEEGESPALSLYDKLENESSLSSLAFYMIDNPEGLKNYLNIYEAFSKEEESQTVAKVTVPFLLLNSAHDGIVTQDSFQPELYSANRNINYVLMEKGSHFMLLEYPLKMARLIKSHIDGIPIVARDSLTLS